MYSSTYLNDVSSIAIWLIRINVVNDRIKIQYYYILIHVSFGGVCLPILYNVLVYRVLDLDKNACVMCVYWKYIGPAPVIAVEHFNDPVVLHILCTRKNMGMCIMYKYTELMF
jgi:hypothetical protein